MSSWYLPHPEQMYMYQAWEKNPLAKRTVDRLATTDGLQAQVEEYVREYTPEQNATHRAYQMMDRIRREAQLYARWLKHLDEMERLRQAMTRLRDTYAAADDPGDDYGRGMEAAYQIAADDLTRILEGDNNA